MHGYYRFLQIQPKRFTIPGVYSPTGGHLMRSSLAIALLVIGTIGAAAPLVAHHSSRLAWSAWSRMLSNGAEHRGLELR